MKTPPTNILCQTSAHNANNFMLTSLSQVGFVNPAEGDYHLGSTSPYRNAGTDGKDIGCQLGSVKDVIAMTRGA